MKAKDLKRSIDWTSETPYAGIKQYFTDSFVMEPKIDGARMRLFFGETQNSMNTGRRSDKTYAYIQRQDNFPLLRDMVVPSLAGTILDGEMVAPSAKITTQTGKTTNSLLNATVALTNCNPADSIKTQEQYGWAQFRAFDVMAFRGRDVTGLPYTQCRAILEEIILNLNGNHPEAPIHIIPQLPSNEASIAEAVAQGYEGVMIKSRTGTYQAGKRSSHWLKVKLMSTFDAFVTGWLPGEGKNAGYVGAIKMSLKDENGLDVEVCQHGALTDEYRHQISNPDGSLKDEMYGQVMELMGQGVTKEGRIRHPHLLRLRPDKTAADCLLDQLEALPRV
jgi:ATP-dependent DNA ligase